MRLFTLLLGLAAFALSPASAQSASDRVPGELIVRLAPGVSGASLATRAPGDLLDFVPVRPLSERLNIWLVRYDETRAAADAALDALRSRPGVTVAQHNHTMTLRASEPDDPRFGEMWGLHNTGQTGGTEDADVDAPEAWDLTRGGRSAHGDDIVIAIVDSGFDLNHPDLPYWKNEHEIPGNGIDDDGNGYVDDYDGWNAYNSSGTITSSHHGTHVAGTAAAEGNNGLGVVGVNWGAKVMPIQGSSSSEATVIEAYGYALELRATYDETDGEQGAFVVATNASFGVDAANPANYPIWCGFYDDLAEYGILSAGATANANWNIDTMGDVPTACPSDYMVAVTNTTHNDTKNSGAGYGATQIDLGAPGTSILSTTPGGGYGSSTGTSMATPHVAGAIGLIISGFSGERLQQYKDDPEAVLLDVKRALLDGTDDIGIVTVSGGRLNLYGSLLESFADDPRSTTFTGTQTIADQTFEGENLYVLDGSLLVLEGDITLQADDQGTPSFLVVVGQLDDANADVTLLDGSQIIYRDGSSPVLPLPPPGPGLALAFDGDARVSLDDASDLPTTGELTVSMWMQADAFSAAAPVLFEQADGDDVLYRLDMPEVDGVRHFRYTHTAGGTTVEYVFDELEVEEGAIYHVALERETSPALVRLFVGGERVGSTFLLPGLPDAASEPAFMLGAAADGSEAFEGLLDEVRVHNLSIGGGLARAFMHMTLNPDLGPLWDRLAAYFRMEGDEAATVFDYSAEGHHAVASGTEAAASPFPVGQTNLLLDGTLAGEVGIALESGAAILATPTSELGGPNTLALYLYDADPAGLVSDTEETLPEDVTDRSEIVWGAYERGEVTADLTVSYAGFPVESLPEGEIRLLARSGPLSDWTDVTADWSHDLETLRFTASEVEDFAEYALGFTGLIVANEDGSLRADAFTFSAAYPNPFRGAAAFMLEVAEAQPVTVEVFDVLGRRVAVLHDGPLAPGEAHRLALDGQSLPSGVYVVRATGEAFSATQRVTRVR